jgi:RNA polymerase sigma-70 factor (ECF subfamily)
VTGPRHGGVLSSTVQMPIAAEISQDRAWHAATVARVLRGDTEAYAALVARHRDRLLRYAMRMLGDADDAEDATQETFVRAFRSLASCEDPSNFGGWIFTILANRCRTAGTRRARRDAVFVSTGARLEDWTDDRTMHADELSVDSVERVQRALTGLSAAHREAFVLKYVEDMSYDEMSVVTGAGVSALKMRVSRAREFLRATLLEDA